MQLNSIIALSKHPWLLAAQWKGSEPPWVLQRFVLHHMGEADSGFELPYRHEQASMGACSSSKENTKRLIKVCYNAGLLHASNVQDRVSSVHVPPIFDACAV